MKSEEDNLRSPAEMDDFLNEGIEKVVSNLMSRSDISGLIDYVYMYVIDVGRVQCRAYLPLDGNLEDKSKKDAISAAVFQELSAGGFVSSPGGVGYEWSSTERVNKYYNGSYLFEMR
jgi:hypothetical protein